MGVMRKRDFPRFKFKTVIGGIIFLLRASEIKFMLTGQLKKCISNYFPIKFQGFKSKQVITWAVCVSIWTEHQSLRRSFWLPLYFIPVYDKDEIVTIRLGGRNIPTAQSALVRSHVYLSGDSHARLDIFPAVNLQNYPNQINTGLPLAKSAQWYQRLVELYW